MTDAADRDGDGAGDRAGDRAGRRILVADPHCARREHLVRRNANHRIMEAASLCEAFPLAESFVPELMALSADFLVEPEVEGLVRLAGMLDCRIFLYSGDGPPARGQATPDLPCVPLESTDTIADLLDRFRDPRRHFDRAADAPVLPDLVLIGASTGGIAAVEAVLHAFPADCPPTLVVQHIREGFVGGLVRRLNGTIRPQVIAAVDGDRLRRGAVYFAADGARHLALAGLSVPRCSLIAAAPVHGHRPAVDVLFESAVPWAGRVSAALLTGMGADGAAGLGALRRAGAFTIAQDRGSSVVWGMPRVAIESGAAGEVLPLDRIGPALLLGHGRSTTARMERRR